MFHCVVWWACMLCMCTISLFSDSFSLSSVKGWFKEAGLTWSNSQCAQVILKPEASRSQTQMMITMITKIMIMIIQVLCFMGAEMFVGCISEALNHLADQITNMQQQYPDSLVIFGGDFNRANLNYEHQFLWGHVYQPKLSVHPTITNPGLLQNPDSFVRPRTRPQKWGQDPVQPGHNILMKEE